jgi:PAS domain S-box-containing protein
VHRANRRAAPRDPAEVRRLLASIVDYSDDAIYGKDLDGIITSWNASSQRVYGYTAEEVLGQSVAMLMPPEYRGDLPAVLKRLRSGEGIQHYETVRLHKSGRQIPVSLTISPIRDDVGNIIGASTIARDISQRRLDESRWRLLAEFGDTLSGVLEVDRLLIDIADLLVKEIADFSVSYRVDTDGIHRVGAAHRSADQLPLVKRLTEIAPPRIEERFGVDAVVRTGDALLIPEVQDETLMRAGAHDPRFLEVLRALDPVSAIVIPLGPPGRIIGAVTLATTALSDRRYTERDLVFVSELADRAGLALENARLYQATQAELIRREAW